MLHKQKVCASNCILKLELPEFQALGGEPAATLAAEDCKTLAEACQIPAVPLDTFYQRQGYSCCWLLCKQNVALPANGMRYTRSSRACCICASSDKHTTSFITLPLLAIKPPPAALCLPESVKWRYKSKPLDR